VHLVGFTIESHIDIDTCNQKLYAKHPNTTILLIMQWWPF